MALRLTNVPWAEAITIHLPADAEGAPAAFAAHQHATAPPALTPADTPATQPPPLAALCDHAHRPPDAETLLPLLREELFADAVVRVGPVGELRRCHRLLVERVGLVLPPDGDGDGECAPALTEEQLLAAYTGGGLSTFLARLGQAVVVSGRDAVPSAAPPPPPPAADATLVSADGLRSYAVHRCLLAHRSEFFRASFEFLARPGAEDAPVVVHLPFEHATAALLDRLLPYLYTHARPERDGVLQDPDAIVPVVYVADQLLLPDLRAAALAVLSNRVDPDNAAGLLNVATDLNDGELRARCTDALVANLATIQNSEHFAALPPAVRRSLRALAQASVSNPLCVNARLQDANEFLAMLREAISELKDRQADATQRQADAYHELLIDEQTAQTTFRLRRDRLLSQLEEKRARLAKVDHSLERATQRIEFMVGFLARQERLFGSVVFDERRPGDALARASPPTAQAAGSGGGGGGGAASETSAEGGGGAAEDEAGGVFVPRYEWQDLPVDVQVPTGLELALDLTTGRRRARIPPVWRLAVWVEDPSTTVRLDVTRARTLGEIKAEILARFGLALADADGGAGVLLTDKRTGAWVGADADTVEQARLFDIKNALRVRLDRAAQLRVWEQAQQAPGGA